jgi:predicted RecB family nuclease
MKKPSDKIIYSPSDLIRYAASPYSSWMDRFYLENPDAVAPDAESEQERLLAETGDQHEQAVLREFKESTPRLVEITTRDLVAATAATLEAIRSGAPIIYQAALQDGSFAGFADFLLLGSTRKYEVWDTKLARSPRPYYAIQLCCYSEMLAAVTGERLPEKFGVVLGNGERMQFRVEDFIHYYRHLKAAFLAMHDGFTGSPADCPDPRPTADHGRWSSHAQKFFTDKDHVVQVFGISVGQMKNLRSAGVTTLAELAAFSGKSVLKLDPGSLEKLVAQARLQAATRDDRKANPDAMPRYEVLRQNSQLLGLAALPPAHAADVFFDMEGYPLIPGGLEYLFGAAFQNESGSPFKFNDWWAHDREEEKTAFEGFVDWAYDRWKKNPGMHIYHYAAYEVSALRRLSTRHDTRQEEVDDLLRNNVFVDLYQVVRHGLRIGEASYSLKTIEVLYRPKRSADVTTAVDSIVRYGRWIESGQGRDWKISPILGAIRDYNRGDCESNAGLADWLRKVAVEHGVSCPAAFASAHPAPARILAPDVVVRIARREQVIANLRSKGDAVSVVLADLIDFHRREEKPIWWRMFDRATSTDEELRDDSGCIQGVKVDGAPIVEKKSLIQRYTFDPSQECKLAAGDQVWFAHNLDVVFTISAIDLSSGTVDLKIGQKSLSGKLGGSFPENGSLLKNEYVPPGEIPNALEQVATQHLDGKLPASIAALLTRTPPMQPLQNPGESSLDAAIRVTSSMSGACLVIQGPPGTGKTYAGSRVIAKLLASGRRVGVTSNSHKAIANLVSACGVALKESGGSLQGIVVCKDRDEALFSANAGLTQVESSPAAFAAYGGGIVAGTAWLFSRPEWTDALDFLFIDEAGQVPLANAVAMARCAKNLVLLGDQMQLEQPIQGSHPGDAGLSVLQYALKDTELSKPDAPVFKPVIPPDSGLFLSESRRMHPDVCQFISQSIYEGRLTSLIDCARQRIVPRFGQDAFIAKGSGIVFSAVEHDGNVQQSPEEVERVRAIYEQMLGCRYTASDGKERVLELQDFLFIAPYNAQVRALRAVLPAGARIASVDKFQGQEAPICILSMCCSYGEYGSRGLRFILDRARLNVAISRPQCMAVIVGDPRIADTPATSLNEMVLLNLYCKLLAASRDHIKR